jgi:hypothetical protein
MSVQYLSELERGRKEASSEMLGAAGAPGQSPPPARVRPDRCCSPPDRAGRRIGRRGRVRQTGPWPGTWSR